MIKKALLCALITMSIVRGAHAQSNYSDPTQLPTNSDKMGAGIGNGVNVDHFTGIGNVNVPIFNYTVDGVDAGISLNYDGKGIQVDQLTSSVGLGWDLNAGGYITRQVNGIEDECTTPVGSRYETMDLDRFFLWDTDSTGWEKHDTDTVEYQMRGLWVEHPAHTEVLYDNAADKFTAVFCGRTIDFTAGPNIPTYGATTSNPNIQAYFRYGNEYSFMPANIGVDPGSDSLAIIIVDETGNEFDFVVGDYEEKYTSPSVKYYPAERWVLSRIKTATGKIITYKYVDQYQSYESYHEQVVRESSSGSYWTIDSVGDDVQTWTGDVSHLTEIDYPNGVTATFSVLNAAGQGYMRCDMNNSLILQRINITSNNDAHISNQVTFQLNHSFFNSPLSTYTTFFSNSEIPIDSAKSDLTCENFIDTLEHYGYDYNTANTQIMRGMRLKLTGIDKIALDGTLEPYYSFGYNTRPLPLRFSPRQDVYGYYNNNLPNASVPAYAQLSIPSHQYLNSGVKTIGMDKTPNAVYMQSWILNKVKNGMGGETDIFYEAPPNLFNPSLTNPPPSSLPYEVANTYDGLCVDHIVNRDGLNTDDSTVITYQYTNGIRFFPGTYFSYPARYNYDPQGSTPSNAINRRIFSNHYVSPIDFVNNSNHGYSKVTEQEVGYNNETISKIDYYFSNLSDNPAILDLDKNDALGLKVTHPRRSFAQYALGNIKQLDEYSNSSNVMKSTLFTYGPIPAINMVDSDYFNYGISYPGGSSGNAIIGYQILSGPVTGGMPVTKKEVKNFIGTQTTDNIIQYYYNSYADMDSMKWDDGISHYTKRLYYAPTILYQYQNWYVFDDYPSDYDSTQLSIYNTLNRANHRIPLCEETVKTDARTPSVNPDTVISFSEVLPLDSALSNGAFSLGMEATATLAKPMLDSDFHSIDVSHDYFGTIYTYGHNSTYNFDRNVSSIQNYSLHDDHVNVLEEWTTNHQRVTSAIWDGPTGNKIAMVDNAAYKDIAYTSFESSYKSLGIFDYNKGNWDFDPSQIVFATPGGFTSAITGHYYYNLVADTKISSFNAFPATQKYLVTFWCDTPPTILMGSSTITPSLVTTAGAWKLYAAYFTGNSSTLHIEGPSGGCKIDELRLLPANAAMNTFTYEPLFGLSSASDERNNIVYTEYDAMGRVKVTKDINGRILTLSKHVIHGNDN